MGSCCCCCKSKSAVINPVYKPTTTSNLVFTPLNPNTAVPVKPSPPLLSGPVKNINKVGISNTDPLLLINGYQNEPIVSLEESLKPFDGRIPYLTDQIREAKSKCHFPSEHNLTHDESAAIYLYSMRGGENSVYDHLQSAWDSGDRSQMKPWFKYLKLLKSGLNKLPNAKTEVWQGAAYDKDLEKKLQSNSLPLFTLMGTCSPSGNDIKNDLNQHSGPNMILVGYESVDAKDVTGYTANKGKDMFLWPGVKLNKARDAKFDGNGTLIMHLTGAINKPEPPPPTKAISPGRTPRNDTPMEKHFQCPVPACRNQCRRDHDANHCYGFSYLLHTCSHHCGPTHSCFRCDKHVSNLRECNKCQGRFCGDCCFK